MTSKAETSSLNEKIKNIITIWDDDDNGPGSAVKKEGVNKEKTNASPARRPVVMTPPPSSQRADRGGSGVHLRATPSSSRSQKKYDDDFIDDSGNSSEADSKTSVSTPSRKRKKVSNGDTPSKTAFKWQFWEEQVIWKAMIPCGEKGCDWKAVLRDINARRPESEPRTAKAVSLHWVSMKSKLLN